MKETPSQLFKLQIEELDLDREITRRHELMSRTQNLYIKKQWEHFIQCGQKWKEVQNGVINEQDFDNWYNETILINN